MGTLIEVCADHGINEGLVRTAVSRLVASGRLVGERQGRRSYYRLSQSARRDGDAVVPHRRQSSRPAAGAATAAFRCPEPDPSTAGRSGRRLAV
jgi:phenylacetic acid degradation operon negative regulatory protein